MILQVKVFYLYLLIRAGIAQLARASAFQVEGRGFESRFPLHFFTLFMFFCDFLSKDYFSLFLPAKIVFNIVFDKF